MTKILYLATLDNSGYGQASQDYARSMVAVNIDVVCRRINLGRKATNCPIINDLLKKDAKDCDTLITHCLPTYFEYDGQFKKNIGLFAYETNVLPKLWVKKIRCMDEVWVINSHMERLVKKTIFSHIPMPTRIVPHAIDLNRFSRSFAGLGPIGKLKKETGAFVFYSIDELVSRKNHETMIKAYLTTFSPSENTILVIKTSKDGITGEQVRNKLNQLIDYIKNNLKLVKYPRIEVLAGHCSEDEIDRLHYEGDCYISTSRGEAWGLSAFTAIGFGKTPIVPNCTGFKDYCVKSNSFMVDGTNTPCYGAVDTVSELYKGNDNWFDVNILELKETMKRVYFNKDGCVTLRRKNGLKSLEKFSYENVGRIIKNTLEE